MQIKEEQDIWGSQISGLEQGFNILRHLYNTIKNTHFLKKNKKVHNMYH